MSQKLQVRAKPSRKTTLFVYMHFCIFSDFVFVSLTFYGVICLLSGIRVISNTKLFNRIMNISFFGPDPDRPGGPRRAGLALQLNFVLFHLPAQIRFCANMCVYVLLFPKQRLCCRVLYKFSRTRWCVAAPKIGGSQSCSPPNLVAPEIKMCCFSLNNGYVEGSSFITLLEPVRT